MILIVAPYSPPESSSSPHLGAARKIEAVIRLLARTGNPIVLVNSAHDSVTIAGITSRKVWIGPVEIVEVVPPIRRKKAIGKFLNIMEAGAVVHYLGRFGVPDLVWLYNGYAFESRVGAILNKKYNCEVIEELEDWHFSRGRGINPKPIFDYLLWKLARKSISHSFAVNSFLAQRAGTNSVSLLPGIATNGIEAIASERRPFAESSSITRVGYFGGLSKEKGADVVLRLASELGPSYEFIVTGSGELAANFREQGKNNKSIRFYGAVESEMLLALIRECDVIINPHSSIAHMGNGVFPFKVIEAVASGRVVVSTPVPSEGLEDILRGTIFVDGSDTSFLDAIKGARDFYLHNFRDVERASREAVNRFGESALFEFINSKISVKT